jgi:hypothetical protein
MMACALLVAGLAGCGEGSTSTEASLGLASADAARDCLEAAGHPVIGGPRPAGDRNAPDVELILQGNPPGAFIAFYASAKRARRYEPLIERSARRIHGSVERAGAVAIIWVGEPSQTDRRSVGGCVFGAPV